MSFRGLYKSGSMLLTARSISNICMRCNNKRAALSCLRVDNNNNNNNSTCISPYRHRVRNYSQEPSPDGGSKSRLIWLVYFSGLLGGVMLTAVLRREYHRYQRRKRGIVEMQIPSFGHRLFICKYKDTVLFDTVGQNIEDLAKFAVREDDVWLVSWPRSGSTWTQEIIYLIETGLDFDRAKAAPLDDRFPYLEFFYPGLVSIIKSASPRFIKSHLPFHLLPADIHLKKPKIVYVSRNPKDVLVSYYHFIRMLIPFRFTGKFPEFFTLFMNDQLPYSPWWKHVRDFWEHRNDNNVLFIKYEDLQRDLPGTIRQIGVFLGKSLTDDQVAGIAEHCSFGNMRTNEAVNHTWFENMGLKRKGEADFLRKGTVGDWRNYMTAEMSAQIDRLMEKKLGDSGLSFQDDTGTGSD